jgi:hypothetical protein
MSWFQEELHVYVDAGVPLIPEDKRNKYVGLVEDEGFKRVVIELVPGDDITKDLSIDISVPVSLDEIK